MKKFLLLLMVIVLALCEASAKTITFDFVNETYGLPRETDASSPNIEDGTTITNEGISITFSTTTGYGFRLWKDGLRAYPGEVNFLFSGYQISEVRIYNSNGGIASAQNNSHYNPWGVRWEVEERTTITRIEFDIIVSEDVEFDFVNNTYGLTRQSVTNDPYIDPGTIIENNGVSITFDKQNGNGFRLWKDGLRVYKGECSLTIEAPETINSIVVYYNKGEEAEFTINYPAAQLLCTFAERGSIQKIIIKFGNTPSTQVVPVSQISVTPNSIKGTPGETRQLSFNVYPSNATNKEIMLMSSDSSVATIDSYGIVKLRSAGQCTITAMATDGSGVYGTCSVVVEANDINHTLQIFNDDIDWTNGSWVWVNTDNGKLVFKALFDGVDVTNSCAWSSSNESAAIINKGVLTYIGPGETVIEAMGYYNDVRYSARFDLKVVDTFIEVYEPSNVTEDSFTARWGEPAFDYYDTILLDVEYFNSNTNEYQTFESYNQKNVGKVTEYTVRADSWISKRYRYRVFVTTDDKVFVPSPWMVVTLAGSGVDEVTDQDARIVVESDGSLRGVGYDESAVVSIYNLSGQQIYSGPLSGASIPKGIFVAIIDGKSYKIHH